MKRFYRTYKPLTFWMIGLVINSSLIVYAAMFGGFDDPAPALPMTAAVIGVIAGFFNLMATIPVVLDLNDNNWFKEKWKREGPIRIVASEEHGRVVITKHGGNKHACTLGEFSPDDAEAAIECMEQAKHKYLNIVTAEMKEARRLAGILNG